MLPLEYGSDGLASLLCETGAIKSPKMASDVEAASAKSEVPSTLN